MVADGENNPLVATADGVADAQNRRGRDRDGATGTAAGAQPPPMAMTHRRHPRPCRSKVLPAHDRLGRFTFTVGPIYGHNFKEKDGGETARTTPRTTSAERSCGSTPCPASPAGWR